MTQNMALSGELLGLLGDHESFRAERTESLTNTDKFCRAICAFANDMRGSGLPGYLFIGVDRLGNPTGARIDERLLEQLAGYRDNGNIIPIPDMHVMKESHAGQEIAIVEVRPSDMPPVRYKQVVWIRTGPSEDGATAEQERRLEERRVDRARTWDTRACPDATLNDLALELFKLNYLPKSVAKEVLDDNGRSIEEQLGSLRLYNRKINAPTNGAVLLFGKDPESFFPGAYIQYVKYDGLSQSDTPLNERRESGDLVTVLRSLDALAREISNARPARQPDLSEETVADYPAVALHELFVNAVRRECLLRSAVPFSVWPSTEAGRTVLFAGKS
jgi:ATP-dependent DNA helicase RecG